MIVQRSEVALRAAHLQQVQRTTTTTVRAWAGDPAVAPLPRPGTRRTTPVPATPPTTAGPEPTARAGGPAGVPGSRVPGRLATLVTLVEWLTGQRVHVLDPDELGPRRAVGRQPAAPEQLPGTGGPTAGRGSPAAAAGGRASPGWGLELTTTTVSVRREQTAFAATGAVTTTDGRRIDVAVDLFWSAQRSATSSTRLQAGEAATTDPLVLSFGTAAALGPNHAPVDLDGDGAPEQLPGTAAGSAYLVLDRNGDGVLDHGAELFGPTSGDGFAELAGYDADGNGWIDEADPVFGRLGLAAGAGGAVTPLPEAGVGALGLARVSTPFTALPEAGLLRSSGIWLGEDGSVGGLHQIDLAG